MPLAASGPLGICIATRPGTRRRKVSDLGNRATSVSIGHGTLNVLSAKMLAVRGPLSFRNQLGKTSARKEPPEELDQDSSENGGVNF